MKRFHDYTYIENHNKSKLNGQQHFLLAGLWFEFKGFTIVKQVFYSFIPFNSGYFLEMGSHELFAQASLKPVFLISASQVAMITSVSHWHQANTHTLSLSFFFLVVLEFELKALHLLCRCSTI
jgi:hypothetical protein